MSMNLEKFKMKVFNAFLVLLVLVCELLSSEVSRPRGVSLSRASLYSTGEHFTCLDGSKVIPFSHVNDDYCDCPDASDEPGTSACPNGVFHCTNAGHKPQNIASSRVNDGICDCCDGSDEYAGKQINCINNCLELGRSAREEAQRIAELVKAGKQLKAELSQRGIQLKQEKKEKLSELQRNRDEAVKVRNEKEVIKKELEELEGTALEKYRKLEEEEKARKAEEEASKLRFEAIETFIKFDSNQDGVLDISELQTRHIFDKDENGEVSGEEIESFLNSQGSIDQEQFISVVFPNIKPLLMMKAGIFKPPAAEENDEDGEDDAHAEDDSERLETDSEGVEDIDEAEEDHEQPYDEHVEETIKPYDEDTQKLVNQATASRSDFSEAERVVRDLESEIKNIEEYLEKDFGPEEEFATLLGQCFEFTDHEYIYKLCPFDKTAQLPKSSSSETRLGVWGNWAGPEHDKYQAMMYERGQSCWNGPQRSSKVNISCGSENKVTSVSEPNRCEYLFEFVTPAACRELSSDNDVDEDVHDEL